MYAKIDPVIDYSVRGLCRKPYHNHPKGCPNWGKDKCPPGLPKLEDYFDVDKPLYLIWNKFDIGKHIDKMNINHPDWTDYQKRCVLYWQGTARSQLKKEIEEFKKDHPECSVTTGPEAMGVNVTATMKKVGVMLEWPPMKYSYQIALGGSKKIIKEFESFLNEGKVKWYEKGDLGEEEDMNLREEGQFKVGDIIRKSSVSVVYFDNRNQPYTWKDTAVSPRNYKVSGVEFFDDAVGYTGQVIKFSNYWPWFRADGFELAK